VSPASTDVKLEPDATEITTGSSHTLPKVQLDIDDAPFLREPESKAPPPPPQKDAETDAPLEVAPPSADDIAAKKKKKLKQSGQIRNRGIRK